MIHVYSHRPLRAMFPSRYISGWLMIRPSKRLIIWSRTFGWEQTIGSSYRWYVLVHGCLCPQRHPMSNSQDAFIEFCHEFLKNNHWHPTTSQPIRAYPVMIIRQWFIQILEPGFHILPGDFWKRWRQILLYTIISSVESKGKKNLSAPWKLRLLGELCLLIPEPPFEPHGHPRAYIAFVEAVPRCIPSQLNHHRFQSSPKETVNQWSV